MKYNLKLSRPQAQQLKDVMQRTSFTKIDQSWKVFARVCNTDKNGNALNLKNGDIVVYAPDEQDSGFSKLDYANKVIVFDWMVKSRGQVQALFPFTGNTNAIMSAYQEFGTTQGVYHHREYATLYNPDLAYGFTYTDANGEPAGHQTYIIGTIKSLNGDFSLVDNVQFSASNESFSFCEIQLDDDIFIGNSVIVPDIEAKLFHYFYFEEEGEQKEQFFWGDYFPYTGTINGVQCEITPYMDVAGNSVPATTRDIVEMDVKGESEYGLAVVHDTGRTKTLEGEVYHIYELQRINPSTVITNFVLKTRPFATNDIFDVCGSFCGTVQKEYWDFDDDENHVLGDFVFDEVTKSNCGTFIMLKSFGDYSLFRKYRLVPNFENSENIGGGGGGEPTGGTWENITFDNVASGTNYVSSVSVSVSKGELVIETQSQTFSTATKNVLVKQQ